LFTGIIKEVGRIVSLQPAKLMVGASMVVKGMELGQSIAVNGACLTVIDYNEDSFTVDVMPETVARTALRTLSAGDMVNLERPLLVGGQIGGHFVQGHVDATGSVVSLDWNGAAMLVKIETTDEVMKYVVEKGFIAVDGISLTVVSRDERSFQVSIVGYTRTNTVLGNRRVGDLVNLEVDIIAKYVEQLTQARRNGVTVDFLKEHGFWES